MTQQLLSLAWQRKSGTNCSRLRELLADGQWHHMDVLRTVAGWRYGARALELRTGQDGGPPLLIEKRCVGADEWEYRCAGLAERPHEPRSVAAVLAELRAEVARLRAENASLLAQLGGGR